MRLAIIDKTEPTGFGGMQMFSDRLRHFVTTHGHEAYFLRYSNEKQTDDHVIPLPYYIREPRTYIFVPSPHVYRLVVTALQHIQPDILYLYIGLSPFDFFMPSIAQRFRIPLTGIWHADYNPSRNLMQLCIKAAFLYYMPLSRRLSLLHVFSEKMKQFHVAHGVPQQNILVLPNGVDASFYSSGPSQFAKEHGIQTGILFLGRLSVQKNPEVLLKSFLSLNPPDDVKLVVVGGGDLERTLRSRYRDPRIIFTGAILDPEKKRDIMRACQIFVQPSLMEGVSIALLEAMATGLASITSDAGSNQVLLQDSGSIIAFNSLSEQLPQKLRAYLFHPELVRKMGLRARHTILQGYTEKKIFRKLFGAFEETITKSVL